MAYFNTSSKISMKQNSVSWPNYHFTTFLLQTHVLESITNPSNWGQQRNNHLISRLLTLKEILLTNVIVNRYYYSAFFQLWSFFPGSSPDLMPSIMGVFDAYIIHKESNRSYKTSTPKRSHQLNNFAHLSPCVQKILSNVPEQEISKKFSSEETLGPRRNRFSYRSMRSSDKNNALNRSNESLDIISPGWYSFWAF